MNRAAAFVLSFAFACQAHGGEVPVNLVKTPGSGIQPQVLVDAKGTLHLLYFTGEAKGGNLQYARREPGQVRFSAPIKVNSQPGSAIATGTIRGGQLALGRNGRVHVAWNGSGQAAPKNTLGGTPMLYARLDDSGKAFEPQRNLMTKTNVLDGGGSLAADSLGNVYVAWHAQTPDTKGEDQRRLWVSVSNNDGKTFDAEKPAWSEPTGACPCCGVRGYTDRQGNSLFLYRGAGLKINRGMYVLRTKDQGQTFGGLRLDNWKIDTCPMSSEALAEGPSGLIAAWDNDGQIFFTRVTPSKLAADPAKSAPGAGGNRKHPALAVNKDGITLLVWTEGTGWNRGGALAWQLYDKAGNPVGKMGNRPGAVPVWGLPAAVAEADGSFTILH